MHRRAGVSLNPSASSKVPEVNFGFWVIKILTTGMGETTSDFLVRNLDPPPVIALAGLVLIGSVVAQILSPRYVKWLYWWSVVMVAIFGTMVADVVHVVAGVPYSISTGTFAAGLAVVLVLWHQLEGTLSIHSISTRRREAFYWATVLATFALGTAAGDLTASSLGLGYLVSGIVFAIAFISPFVVARFGGLGEVATFWTAYIITRPLGASFADWMGVTVDRGGLGWGTGWVSLALGLAVSIAVAWSGRRIRFQPTRH